MRERERQKQRDTQRKNVVFQKQQINSESTNAMYSLRHNKKIFRNLMCYKYRMES